MAVKGLITAIIQFLTQQLEDGDITADSRESLEVAIQCLESAYGVQASDAPAHVNLYDVYKTALENAEPSVTPEESANAKAMAETLKNEGNALVKAEKYHEALAKYTKAIQLDSRNAVYYCNRGGVHSKIGNHQEAIKDCRTALSIDPSYSKAYSRLGLAYSSLKKHKEAKESYQKALEMEPDNESYRNNLQVAEEKLAQHRMSNIGLTDIFPGVDSSVLLSNPTLMGMARQMLADPVVHNLVSNIMTGNVEQEGRNEALVEASQRLAQQMQYTTPEILDTLRQMGRHMRGNPNDQNESQQD